MSFSPKMNRSGILEPLPTALCPCQLQSCCSQNSNQNISFTQGNIKFIPYPFYKTEKYFPISPPQKNVTKKLTKMPENQSVPFQTSSYYISRLHTDLSNLPYHLMANIQHFSILIQDPIFLFFQTREIIEPPSPLTIPSAQCLNV